MTNFYRLSRYPAPLRGRMAPCLLLPTLHTCIGDVAAMHSVTDSPAPISGFQGPCFMPPVGHMLIVEVLDHNPWSTSYYYVKNHHNFVAQTAAEQQLNFSSNIISVGV